MNNAIKCLWRDACAENSFWSGSLNIEEPKENTPLSVKLRSVFGLPFARGYDTESSNIKIVSLIYAGAAEIHTIDSNYMIVNLNSDQQPIKKSIYDQIMALYHQHLSHGRKIRFSRHNEISHQIHREIIILLNRNCFGLKLQISKASNHKDVTGKIHDSVYEVKYFHPSTSLILKETR